jgi:hypothetical protein
MASDLAGSWAPQPTGDRVTPVVEDPVEVAAHKDRPSESADRTERQRIVHEVAHDGAPPVSVERVRVMPHAIGPA